MNLLPMATFPLLVILLFMGYNSPQMLSVLLLFELLTTLVTFWAMATVKANLMSFSLVILTLGAVEASMGLALIVLMTRSHGSDRMKTIY